MSTNINSTEQIVEINAGDQITNVNIVSQSTTQVISGEQVVTIDTNAGTIPAAWGSITGTLSNQTDLQTALNLKQNQISLTTQGTSGAATFIGSVLNIPNYTDTGLTSVGVSMPTGFDVSGSPLTSNGTINVNFASGYGLPTTAKQGQWDQAYNDKINSAEVSGTTTKTLILNQQDGGTITASWSDIDTGLTSVGLAMPSAFTVSGSPLTSNGTITVTGAGTTSQYVRGDGSLAAFPSVSNEAKTLIREVYNKTGATLTKGTVIYIDGGQGNLPTVTKAIATGDPTSAQTFGIVQSNITNMNNGFVVVAGGIDNLDTQAYSEGTALFLSPTTAGTWTSTKPYAPDHMVYLGVVVRSHPTQGVIEIKIQNGVELDEIHNVSARFPVNKDGLFYNSTSGVWENKSIAGVLGYTPVPETRIITINGTAQNLSADRTYSVGTVTSVAASGGTGISIAGSPVTGSGTITITNTAPDQVVGLTGAGTTSISGTYPNFTITSNDQYTGTVTSVAASGGTGISISGSPVTGSGTINITNTAPDQIVSLTGAGTTSISGTYPNFTVTSNDQYVGTVTSVNATVPTGFEVSGVPITSSGTVDIKFASGYSLPTTAKQGQWDDAYAKRIDSLTVTGNSGSSTLTSNVLNVPTYTLTGLGGEPAITAGTTLQYFRGDKTFQTLNTSVVPESGNVYFTEPRVRATVLSGLNITGGSISASDSVLNAFGKVQNQINGLIGGSIFQSTWNASTNTPSLASGVGTKGYYYIVSVAGTTNLDGITDWQIGDWAIFDGTVWRKVDNTDAVVSVNGFTGAVNLGLGNISDVTLSSPTNTQLLRFNGTSSKWENWTPTYISGNQTITLSGDISGSGTTTIATTIGAGKVTNAMLAGSIAASKLVGTDIATVGTITTGIWNGTTIAIANGGTGQTTKADAFNALSPMTTLGDIIYGGASGAGTRLAGNTAASKRFLIQTGDGTNSAAPSWGSIAAADVPTLNQNTTGSAATLTTARNFTINGTAKSFDGSANVSWTAAEIGLTSYLPLTGGTLTGALSGTSATFSINQNSDTIVSVSNTTAGTGSQAFFQATSDTTAGYTTFGKASSSFTAYKIVTSSSGYFFNTKGDIAILNDNATGTIKMAAGGSTSAHFTISSTGAATFSGQVDAASFYTSDTRYVSNQIQAGYNTNAEDVDLWVNYSGYQGGTTRFRDFRIGNGKNGQIAFFDGSTGAATFSNSFSTSDVSAAFLSSSLGTNQTVYLELGKNFSNTYNTGELAFKYVGDGSSSNMISLGFYGAGQKLNVLGNGNVGIGTTSPTDSIIGSGTFLDIASTSGGALKLHFTNATAYGEFSFYKGSNGSFIDSAGAATVANNDLIFRTGGTASNYGVTERMRITSGGDMLFATGRTIGVNTSDGTDTSFLLISGGSAASPGRGAGLVINGNDRTTYGGQLDLFTGDSATSYMTFSIGSGEKMRITNGGELLINTTTDSGAYPLQVNGNVLASGYFESSDIRLKDVLTNSYSENFSAIEFMWKDKRDEKNHWGYAAQDVLKYIPDAVETNKDGYMTVNYNEAHTWKIAQLEAKIKELEAKLK